MMKRFLICLLVSIVPYFAYAGGGWTAKKGNGYFKLGQSALLSDELFNQAGERSSITTTGIYITSFYGEYGLTDRLEGLVQIPFFFRTTINELRFRSGKPTVPGDEFNYLGDPSLGLKYALLYDQPFVLSISARADFPVGRTDGGDSKIIQSGDGEFNQLVKIDAGYSFRGNKLYMSAGVGVNNRSNDFSEEFQYNYEVGYKIGSNLFAIGKLQGTESFFNGHAADNASGIFSNNMEQLTITPQLSYESEKKWGISGSMAYPLQGKNILADPIYELGIFYKLAK